MWNKHRCQFRLVALVIHFASKSIFFKITEVQNTRFEQQIICSTYYHCSLWNKTTPWRILNEFWILNRILYVLHLNGRHSTEVSTAQLSVVHWTMVLLIVADLNTLIRMWKKLFEQNNVWLNKAGFKKNVGFLYSYLKSKFSVTNI
jgi:hypothetical protein